MQDPKKWTHNYLEKRRKDRIKAGIMRLGELLPDQYLVKGQVSGLNIYLRNI